jgi:hypothetical protein
VARWSARRRPMDNEKPPEGGPPKSQWLTGQEESYPRISLHATATIRVSGHVIPARGFFSKALSGKVRPAPREPRITHYGCSCCRWTA